MSFIYVHLLQRPKAIYFNRYKSFEEPVKAKNALFLPKVCCLHGLKVMGLSSLDSCACTCIVKGLI